MTLRTLEELKRDFMDSNTAREQNYPNKKKNLKPFAAIADALFILTTVIILFIILYVGSDGGNHKTIFNCSYFTVLTSSMRDEIPKGSFILVKQASPRELKTGDNITYTTDRNTTVTHKIVGVYENYDDSGGRGFQTQGVNNANPDKDIVNEANVVGKVIFVLPVAGAVLANLSENSFLALTVSGLCLLIIFFTFFRGVFAKTKKNGFRK